MAPRTCGAVNRRVAATCCGTESLTTTDSPTAIGIRSRPGRLGIGITGSQSDSVRSVATVTEAELDSSTESSHNITLPFSSPLLHTCDPVLTSGRVKGAEAVNLNEAPSSGIY